MKRLAIALLVLTCTSSLFAAVRTFVSISGADSGTCPTTAPCRSLSYAYGQTDAGGDIVMIDSGGFGFPFTIGKAINIVAPAGVFGVIQINTNSTAGININAGVNDIVRIQSLTFVGTGPTNGDTGILITQCKRAELADITARNVGEGIRINPDTRVSLERGHFSNVDIAVHSVGTNALPAVSTLKVWVWDTIVQGALTNAYKADSGSFVVYGGNQFGDGSRTMFTPSHYSFLTNVTTCSNVTATPIYTGQPTDTRSGSNTYTPCSQE